MKCVQDPKWEGTQKTHCGKGDLKRRSAPGASERQALCDWRSNKA